MLVTRIQVLTLFSAAVMLMTNVSFADAQTIVATKKEQSKTLWYGYNVWGKVYIKIRSESESNCVKLEKKLAGFSLEVRQYCGHAEIDVFSPLILKAEIIAHDISSKTAFAISNKIDVAMKSNLCEVALDCDGDGKP